MKRVVLAAALLLVAPSASAATPRVQESALRRHIAFLASDRLEGRAPGTPGAVATERYIIRQFERAGLKPAGKGGGWYQRVTIPTAKGRAPVVADNVVGRIAGSDPGAGAVLFMAHWDHLGLCAEPPAEDRICNGAVDNASGVGALIEIARGLAQGARPVRDILFVATTGEEKGLLGAKALAKAPPVPLREIVAAFNLDTVAVAPKGAAVVTIGRGMTKLDPLIEETARALGRTVDTSDSANDLVKRQDGWALMQAGVPAVVVGGAYGSAVRAFLASRYHHPDDEIEGIELGGAAEDADLLIAIGRVFADPARYKPATNPLDLRAVNH